MTRRDTTTEARSGGPVAEIGAGATEVRNLIISGEFLK